MSYQWPLDPQVLFTERYPQMVKMGIPVEDVDAVRGRIVEAPLIKECLANIECKVVDIIGKHDIVVLEGVAAYADPARAERRTIHAVGDGTFIVDGRRMDRRKMMASKLPGGL